MLEGGGGLWALLSRLASRQSLSQQISSAAHKTKFPSVRSLASSQGASKVHSTAGYFTGLESSVAFSNKSLAWLQASKLSSNGSPRGFAALAYGDGLTRGRIKSCFPDVAVRETLGRTPCESGHQCDAGCKRHIHTTNASQSERDFYAVLEVPRTADAREIKKAYYRLAKKLHPDSNKGRDANERFQELQRAYSTLKDDEKRRVYDQIGHENFEKMESSGAEGGGDPFTDAFAGNIHDIFSAFMGQRGGGFRTADDFFSGAFVAQVQQQISISFMDSIEGCSRELNVPGARQKVKVELEPGVQTGEMLSVRPTPTLEIILNVVVAPHKIFRREGFNILRSVNVDVVDAMLGTIVTVETVRNRMINVDIPECTQQGDRLVVRGEGVRTKKRTGDFHLIVKLMVPSSISDSQRRLLEEFQNEEKLRRAA